MRLLLLLAALLLFAAPGPAAGDVVITQEVETAASKGQMKLFLRGQKVRADLAEPLSLLYDGHTGETVYLQWKSKTYTRVSREQKQLVGAKLREELAAAPGLVQPGGQKRTILGVPTELFVFTTGGFRLGLWTARDYPGSRELRALLDGMQDLPLRPSWEALPGLFLRTEMEGAGQKVAYTITSIDATASVPASTYEIPAGFREVPVVVPGEATAGRTPEPAPVR